MKRIHLFEWEDQQWFPKAWRDYGTDYLRFIAVQFKIYDPIIPILKKALNSSGDSRWIDFASGGGSAILPLAKTLKNDFPKLLVTLTDYYPNQQAFQQAKEQAESLVEFESESVDARNPPKHLQGKPRTIFGAFHHFKPDDARSVLQNAVDTKSPIIIIEPLSRDVLSWLSMIFVIPNVLLLTPFIRPVRWQVLPFIYLIPIIPLYVLWDGCVSILRMYSKKELIVLINQVENNQAFDWEIDHVKGKPSAVHYVLGTPKKS